MRLPVSLMVVASVATLSLVVCSTANAQGVYYSTNFDSGTDTVNDVQTTANYNIYAGTAATQPLDGVNNWASNDGTTVADTSGTKQQVGRSDYVGTFGAFFNGSNGSDTTTPGTLAGALGGVYRLPAASATVAAPDVVPSANSGGIVTLYHPVSITPAAGMYSLTADLVLLSPGSFATNRDTFGFTLSSATGNLLTINFTPGTPDVNGNPTDSVGYTIGGTTTTTTSGLTLDGQYHMILKVNTAGSGNFSVSFQGATGATFGISSTSLAGSTIATTAVNRFGVLWNLADKTVTAGAVAGDPGSYQNAGSNSIAFDNVTFAVPEPSTDAMLALGLVGLAGLVRSRRQRA